jgi:hypothetical protein
LVDNGSNNILDEIINYNTTSNYPSPQKTFVKESSRFELNKDRSTPNSKLKFNMSGGSGGGFLDQMKKNHQK